ncbi:MAG: hypothetical protein OCD02_21315 [Spirochaetaceae bacterium]
MNKNIIKSLFALTSVLVLMSCGKDYSGTYTGYSWKGEFKGVILEEASQKIETTLVLDKKGNVLEASMDFMKLSKSGESWYLRNDPSSTVTVDFSVEPSLAQPQSDTQDYTAGSSMFNIKTNDKMSFFAVAVNDDSTLAFVMVDPFHRYMSELKLTSDFDYSRPISDITIANGLLIPTVRTSGSGYIKPTNWEKYENTHLFGFYEDEYVYIARGTYRGLTSESSIQELMEKAGVSFNNGIPKTMSVEHGFFSSGGWTGNYKTVGNFIVGKNVKELDSLIDWSIPKFKNGVNDNNFFGVDIVSGATKTAQDSTDGISGATVRMSRESTSYQRALVAADVITEKQVIKGRF